MEIQHTTCDSKRKDMIREKAQMNCNTNLKEKNLNFVGKVIKQQYKKVEDARDVIQIYHMFCGGGLTALFHCPAASSKNSGTIPDDTISL